MSSRTKILKLTRRNSFLSPQNEHAHAQFLQTHSWRWELSQLCKSSFTPIHILRWLTLPQNPPCLNIGLPSREVTQGTPKASRSALCSSLQRLRPTRVALRCFITYWRYTQLAQSCRNRFWHSQIIASLNRAICELLFFFACFFKEAEANHPELLALPDEIEICDKAAGYNNPSDLHELIVLLVFSQSDLW